MMQYTAVGEPDAVKRYLDDFARHTGADELIVTLMSPDARQPAPRGLASRRSHAAFRSVTRAAAASSLRRDSGICGMETGRPAPGADVPRAKVS